MGDTSQIFIRAKLLFTQVKVDYLHQAWAALVSKCIVISSKTDLEHWH